MPFSARSQPAPGDGVLPSGSDSCAESAPFLLSPFRWVTQPRALRWLGTPIQSQTSRATSVRYRTTRAKPNQNTPLVEKTTATVSNLADNTTYYFTVVARNTLGLESPPSNEVSYRTPPLGSHKLTVINGTGSGYYTEGTLVPVSANPPEKGQQFERWIGDYQIILDPPTTMRTKALMLFRDLKIEASYNPESGNDRIRYHPRRGWAMRMVGGIFEGTNQNRVTGTYSAIYTIRFGPPPGWSEVNVNLRNFRYLRYRGPKGSYGNVAEIEFYRNEVKVSGSGYGTPGSWNGNGNNFSMALDGNVETRFDGPTPDGVYVGIDSTNDKIRYYPRPRFAARMVSGVFEGTNGNPTTGTYTPIYTISSQPPEAWSEVSVNLEVSATCAIADQMAHTEMWLRSSSIGTKPR